jgi:hypothetical protein
MCVLRSFGAWDYSAAPAAEGFSDGAVLGQLERTKRGETPDVAAVIWCDPFVRSDPL